MKSPKDFKKIDDKVAQISNKPKNKMGYEFQEKDDKKTEHVNIRTTLKIKTILEDQAFYNKRNGLKPTTVTGFYDLALEEYIERNKHLFQNTFDN